MRVGYHLYIFLPGLESLSYFSYIANSINNSNWLYISTSKNHCLHWCFFRIKSYVLAWYWAQKLLKLTELSSIIWGLLQMSIRNVLCKESKTHITFQSRNYHISFINCKCETCIPFFQMFNKMKLGTNQNALIEMWKSVDQ